MVISNLLDIIRLLFVREKKPFLRLRAILGFYPHDIHPYRQALIHKSMAYHEQSKEKKEVDNTAPQKYWQAKRQQKKQQPSKQQQPTTQQSLYINNERLEFLGDAVLGAIVSDILYQHYGKKQEGFLSTLKSKLICRATLNQVAIQLGLDQLIRHAGAVTTGHNSFMSGNAFEALIGAIYIDRGYDYCHHFLSKKVFGQIIDIEKVEKQEQNYKSRIIEWCQKHQYKFAFTQKSAQNQENGNIPFFRSTVLIEGVPCGTGYGYSKKESDQSAAQQAYTRIKRDKDLKKGIAKAAALPRTTEGE